MRRTGLLVAVCCLQAAVPVAPAAEPPSSPQAEQFFETRVRPVLAENCFSCHGPKKQMGGLRLDTRAALLAGGDSGAAVQPGDPDHSPLVQAVRRQGDLKMPPKAPLKPEAVEALTAWVKAGAPWPSATVSSEPAADAWKKHWAFQPVRNPPLPAVRDQGWSRTGVDHFILARLEAQGLKPSPAADRRTLIRRVTFDLTGLPPTPAEVAAFEADTSSDAFARVVDRLLASPAYGERWGRHWLDVARYADTKGYVFTQEPKYPWAWTYRDYVIRAFNDDLPYDRFIIEQLAADLLPLGSDRRPLTALGFLTLGNRFLNNTHDVLDDRIDVVSRGLLGLTVSCARCHDHKFDPIPTADYYSLYGVFASSVEPAVPPIFDAKPAGPEFEAFEKELAIREQKLNEFISTKKREVTTAARTRAAEYMLRVYAGRNQPNTQDFMIIADPKDLNPRVTGRWRNYLTRTRSPQHPVFAPWHAFAALPESEFEVKARALSALFVSGKEPFKRLNPLVAKRFAERPPKTMAEAAAAYGELLNGADKLWQDALSRAAAARQPPPTRLPDPAQEELRQVFYGPDTPPNIPSDQFSDLTLVPDRAGQAELAKFRKAVEEWRSTGKGAPPRAMALQDAATPYEPHVFIRGNPGRRGEAVPRQFLEVVAGKERKPFTRGSGRLELARAIADRQNPLTARVLVNRVWLHHFGAALVRTPGDFGLRSEPPTHPELLDHLATFFMESGWSVKQLHRLILLSAVYRQKSDDRADGRRLDPDNRLFWRTNRQRLDFESLRDAVLAVSGRLDRTAGGPAVDIVSPAAGRRTVYGFIDRLHLPGMFRTFDYPNPDATSPQRDNTTVPQQALFLMNNPFALEAARSLAQRPEVAAAKDLPGKVTALYRLLYGRPPSAEELKLAAEFIGPPGDPATWTRYAQALLVANEFMFVD